MGGIQVENNATQSFINHVLEQHNIPVHRFQTGINKADISTGIPFLANLIKGRRIIFPTGCFMSEAFTHILTGEALMMGEGHTGDVLMATWFCVDLIRKLNPAGFNSELPSPDAIKINTQIGYEGNDLPPFANSLDKLNKAKYNKRDGPRPFGSQLNPRRLPLFGNF